MAGPSILRAMRRLAILPSVAFLALVVAGLASAASPPPAGPPYPDPVDGQAVYDYAGVLGPEAEQTAERIIDAIEAQTKAEVVVYTQDTGRDEVTHGRGRRRTPRRLMDQWGVGRRGIDDGLVILFDLDSSRRARPGAALRRRRLRVVLPLDGRAAGDLRRRDAAGARAPATSTARRSLAWPRSPRGRWRRRRRRPGDGQADRRERAAARPAVPGPGDRPGGLRLRRALLARTRSSNAESVIDGIEARTGAEVVVYSQLLGSSSSTVGDRGAGARAHGPVARRAARASTTAW